MENMSTRSATLENGDVQEAVSGLLQHRFIVERHAVKRIANILNVGCSRAKQILYGDAAPTAAQIFQLMKDMDPAFAPALVNIMAGKELVTAADQARALEYAEMLNRAADQIRRDALKHEEIRKYGSQHP